MDKQQHEGFGEDCSAGEMSRLEFGVWGMRFWLIFRQHFPHYIQYL